METIQLGAQSSTGLRREARVCGVKLGQCGVHVVDVKRYLQRDPAVIIEAEALEMAQPDPWKAMSRSVPPSTSSSTEMRSPQSGL